MSAPGSQIVQASGVVIGARGLLIEGPPGSGKSSLALALLDRGAGLIGDDAVSLSRVGPSAGGDAVFAAPPPHIAGLVEVRGVGIIQWPVAQAVPLALILTLGGPEGERLPERLAIRDVLGVRVPVLPFTPGALCPAVRAEQALRLHGLAFTPDDRA